jgi:GrpB-like predicted nucleotidyltransferase (UPF0157 family)
VRWGLACLLAKRERLYPVPLRFRQTNDLVFAEKVYHVHLRLVGDNDELYFRDYLNAHPQTAKEYEALKLRLWKEFEHDRDACTEAKTEFIKAVTAKARQEYAGRY